MQKHNNANKGLPNKTMTYTPPEWGKAVSVEFFHSFPEKINSKILKTKKRALLVYDSSLDAKQLERVKKLLSTYEMELNSFPLEYGTKNLNTVDQIWTEMIEFHPDIAVALGGGTICDLVGFASSCYHRGLDHIFFPTTLLSMVDACIGGKTGIDYHGVKNSIGQVHYAVESYCFFPFLETLEYLELISGFSEVIKAGMLFEEKLITKIEGLPNKFDTSENWFGVVSRGAELKISISEEPLSQRSRLLYGHNIGHGVETLDSTHRRHGDCVSIGMNVELALAVAAGIVDKKVWERQNNLLKRFNLPRLFPPDTEYKVLKQKMKQYKLVKNGSYLFVIPEAPGKIIENDGDYYWHVTENMLDKLWQDALKVIGQ